MPRLEIKNKNGKHTYLIKANRITIGRQAGNDIVLDDNLISRCHCVIQQGSGGFRVVDLKSHNGTWVGDNRVLEAPLAFGDRFRIGGTFIRLLADMPAKVDRAAETLPMPAKINVPLDQTGEIPEVEVVVEEDEEEEEAAQPQVAFAARKAQTRDDSRTLVRGPLAKQLTPLMEACAGVPVPEGAPETPNDVRLLNRRSEPVAMDGDKHSRPGEAIYALQHLMFACFRTRATDIHIEPKINVLAIRLRIDGILHTVGELTTKMGTALLNVIKILCEIDISKKSIVQEGNFAVELPTRRVDFRISFTPTTYGQKLALRLLDKGSVPGQFENLGMEFDAVAELARVCEQDSGMVILAGPTGSGKTTTLYTALMSIDAVRRNIVTIEDPVEYELANTTQISIDPVHNLTFASVLGSILRQDPDVILVGEVRDQETAKMAMQAATTGHLVLTTIHARDTIGTVFRLLDLGIEPFLIANAVSMCISQRLVRILCTSCKRPYKPTANMVRKMRLDSRSFGDFYQAVGCSQCMETGYRGRMALFEILGFSQQVRDVVLSSPTISELRKAAGEWMFNSLTDSGHRKVIEGLTTIEEVDRVSSMS